MPVPLVHQTSYCVLLCNYLSTYFFLTHIPTHKMKVNLYLPLPIPLQIIDVLFHQGVAHARTTSASNRVISVFLGGLSLHLNHLIA